MPRSSLTAALLALAVGAGCSGDGARSPNAACPLVPGAVVTLPPGFPVLPEQVLYERVTQGKTTVVVGTLPGDDFVAVRDKLVEQLRARGFTILGTDQESVEAEAEFSGPRSGTIRVQPRCAGQLSVRYKLTD